ncbi:MAG: exo-alpha-sialidase [Colwellia sp.]|nr:exo-alpha-sialidase [Colwellia sp.]
MVAKRLSRAYNPPVPAGMVVEWIGSPPHDAGVLPLNGDAFKGDHFPELLAQHGDAVLPTKAAVDGVYPVVGHGQQGDVHLVSNDTDVNFDDIVYDFGDTISGFRVAGDVVIVWANYGKVWGSTDGGNNFTLLPAYLNSGSPANQSRNRSIGDIQHGNGVWLADFGGYFALCRGDILAPANWVALPTYMGGLTNGTTYSKHKIATDGNGNWLVAGAYHQFAWTNDDWVTINVTIRGDGSNGSSLKIPYQQNISSTTDGFCWCSDDGVFFAASEKQNVIMRSDDGMNTWVAVAHKFNTGVNILTTNPQSIVDMGNGHYMVMYDYKFVAESFDMGMTWVRRASYLGLSTAIFHLSTDKKGMLFAIRYSGGTRVQPSKNDGQTFAAATIQAIYQHIPILYWRDAWYAINGNTLVRSLNGYVRTEWELV